MLKQVVPSQRVVSWESGLSTHVLLYMDFQQEVFIISLFSVPFKIEINGENNKSKVVLLYNLDICMFSY